MVLEKTLESPLDCKESQPVHSKGHESWVFIGRIDVEAETPIRWSLPFVNNPVKALLSARGPVAAISFVPL